jgi:rubrerythrin
VGLISGARIGGNGLNIPEEYTCDLCGYVFLAGEVPELFCPNCGSSTVTREISYEEFIEEDANLINMITL